MPFKSKAQLRKFGAMVRRGEISKAKFQEWLNADPSIKKLPERIRKKKTKKRKSRLLSLAHKYAANKRR